MIKLDRELIRVMAALSLTGMGAVMRVAVFPLFATGYVGLTLAQLGYLGAATTATAILTNIVLGRVSDRLPRRDRLIVGSCLWMAGGYLVVALRPEIVVLFLVGVLGFSFSAVPIAQLFAAAGERIGGLGLERPKLALGILRASFSLGFALGPLLSAVLLARSGLRVAIYCVAVPWVAAAALMLPGLSRPKAPSAPRKPAGREVTVFGVAVGLMFLADVVRSGFLAVYASGVMGIPAHRVGFLFAVTSVVNLIMMPAAGLLADRIGARRVVVIGGAAGALAALGTALAASPWVLFAFQALHAIYAAGVISVGLALAQEIARERPGFGIGVFHGVGQVANLLGMSLGGLVAERIGLRPLFLASAVACIGGMLAVAGMRRAQEAEVT